MSKLINKEKSKKGFTLVEMVVVLAIFSVIITVASTIFVIVVKAQQKTNLQRQTSQDARYAIETIMREARMGTMIDTGEGILPPFIISEDGTSLIINLIPDYTDPSKYTSETFSLGNDKKIYLNGNPITADNLEVESLIFGGYPYEGHDADNYDPDHLDMPPYVGITIQTKSKINSTEVLLRTLVTSRNYRKININQ